MENNKIDDLIEATEDVIESNVNKGRKTIQQHFYTIIKVLVAISILTLAISNGVQWYSNNKIEKLTNSINERERKLDSINNLVNESKLIQTELDDKILNSQRKSKIYESKINELQSEYTNIRKKVNSMGVNDAFTNVSEHLDSLRTRNQERNQ